jgi:hypothetical protein
MEALPGIAHVLRSPVADAMIGLIRAAARLQDFQYAHAEELVKYATRRSLLGNDEGERVLAEAQAAEQKRLERIAERQHRAQEAAAAAAAPAPKKAAAPKAVKPKAPAPKPKVVKAAAKAGKPKAAAKPAKARKR